MSSSALLRTDHSSPSADTFTGTRRRSLVLPWLLFALIWSLATLLLVLGTEAATFIAAL